MNMKDELLYKAAIYNIIADIDYVSRMLPIPWYNENEEWFFEMELNESLTDLRSDDLDIVYKYAVEKVEDTGNTVELLSDDNNKRTFIKNYIIKNLKWAESHYGSLLRKYRHQHHLTQEELADKIGVTHSAISQYETKRNKSSKRIELFIYDTVIPYFNNKKEANHE